MALQSLESNPQLSFATRLEDWTSWAGVQYEVKFAEDADGAELARKYDIQSAPALIVPEGAKSAGLYRNVAQIMNYVKTLN